jgi:hypothetical protein
MSEYDPINNPASNPDGIARRTGGSPDDPHGGQEATPNKRPDPDPISELATFDPNSQDNNPDRPQLASQPGPKPGFGPDEFTPPQLEGNPELGIDPREAPGSWVTGPKAA